MDSSSCFIVNNKNILMRNTTIPSIFPHTFTLSTASTTFLSNSTFQDKTQNPTISTKHHSGETRMHASEKSQSNRDQIIFRNRVNYGQSTTPPTVKNSFENSFLRNTSYFSIEDSSAYHLENRRIEADCGFEMSQEKTRNLKTCTSLENSATDYEKILEKINKKQRLIDELKQLSKTSVTELAKSCANEAREKSTKVNISKIERTGDHKRGYHSQPNKNKVQSSIQYKPLRADFYRSNATQIKLSSSPPVSSAKEKLKTQMPEEYRSFHMHEYSKNPEIQQPKSDFLKKVKYSPKVQKCEESLENGLPLKLIFNKTHSSTQNDKQKGEGLYTARYHYEPQSYIAPFTTRNQQKKNIYDKWHISDCKRIKNNVKYFSNKAVSIFDFELLKCLGQGKFGTVHQAIHKATNSIFAIKKIPKKIIKYNLMTEQLVKEIKIQSVCRHQNILELFGFFDDHEFIYIVLQYMESGTLFEKLKRNRVFSEEQAASKLRDVAKAIVYMHEKGIAHRDIKPQNIVISNGIGKVCDFGWATVCDDRRKTYCGTFDYAAPEILEGTEYDMSVDLWCLGVLAYELLVGKAPFFHFSRKETMKKIINVQNQNITFPSHLSKNAISFIENLIKKDPQERMSGQKLLNHPFLLQKKQYQH